MCGFLNELAFKSDLVDLKPEETTEWTTKPALGADYTPMRRKLQIEGNNTL